MFTVLIVDDERWIIEGIKAGVNWEKYGFNVIGTAENGQDALMLIQQFMPDFVLTDIKMPIMNGLELIKEGKKLSPQTCFAVLSGHAEFAYAQKALNYGTMFYCLKPFEIEEVEAILEKVASALKERAPQTSVNESNSLYEAICSENVDWVQTILTENHMSVSESKSITLLVMSSHHSIQMLPPYDNMIQFRISKRRICVLIYSHLLDEYLQTLHANMDYSIGISAPVKATNEFQHALEEASIASYSFFATGKHDIYYVRTGNSDHINDILHELTQSLSHKDRVAFSNAIDKCKHFFEQHIFSIKDAYLIFNTVMYLFTKENAKSSIRFLDGYEQLLHEYGSAASMLDYLSQHTVNYFSEEISAKLNNIANSRIKEILMYIHANLHQDISIKGLSEQFYLSPTYLSQLFKKEVGENFVEYVSQHRIELACKLLLETNLSVSQISEKSGFNDYFYFTRIFKRFTNMTPTQYRGKS